MRRAEKIAKRYGITVEEAKHKFRTYIRDDGMWRWMNTELYKLTENDNLFKFYWGHFTPLTHGESMDNIFQLILNRNIVAKFFNLKSASLRAPSPDHSILLDHVEAYTIRGSRKILVISNPYSKATPPQEGAMELPNLYSFKTRSFAYYA